MTKDNANKRGIVYTFYSFKGGVGRSMALANVAALLSREGKDVLVVDWDLEAPGIERYFDEISEQSLSELRKNKSGVIDLIASYDPAMEKQSIAWKDCVLTAAPFSSGVPIDILTAGKNDGDYFRRVQELDWADLFEKRQIGRFIEQLRTEWVSNYDFVLIDSRTGITDIGGICTIHLPDALVLFFTTNWQSLEGVIDVIDQARIGRDRLPFSRRHLIAIPVPARDESQNEYQTAKDWRDIFDERLNELYRDWVPEDVSNEQVLERLRIPYIAHWSFGEKLPVTEISLSDTLDIGFYYKVLSDLISNRLQWNVSPQTTAVQAQEDSEFSSWRRRLRESMYAWEVEGENNRDLLNDDLLAESERWLKERRRGITTEERHYIEDSVSYKSRYSPLQILRTLWFRRPYYFRFAVVIIIAIAVLLPAAFVLYPIYFPAPVTSLILAPAEVSLTQGEKIALQAIILDSDGNHLSNRDVRWISINPTVATATPAGIVVGSSPGETTIIAVVEGEVATSTVTVLPLETKQAPVDTKQAPVDTKQAPVP